MFHSARLKLTVWYLIIAMVISIVFSVVIYHVLSAELDRFSRIQRTRIERQAQEAEIIPAEIRQQLPPRPTFDPAPLEETRDRLVIILVITNIGIFIISGGLGYFLAGRTLHPIQKMMDEQNQFIADASHELRTPLTALRSAIEVHLRDKNLRFDEARALLESNLIEVNQLQSLSDTLLQLAQYQIPNGGYHFKSLSVVKVLDDVMKKIKPIAEKKNIQFVKQVDDLTIEADVKSLSELFLILLDNAVKYSPEKTTVLIMGSVKDDVISITISDEGMGIDPQDLPHIFNRFYRADKSRSKENVSGYGLGLSIAKKIVEVHHGSIEVTQTSEKGSTFLVKLPLHTEI